MGRKLVVFLLAGLLFIILLATPRASAGTDTEYLKYTIESEIQENKIMPPADSGMLQPAPPAPAAVPPPVVPPPSAVVPPSPVVVPPSPDFAISITPASRTVTRGESTTYTVTVKSIGGYSGHVALSVSGLPSGAGYSLPSRVTPPANGSAVATLTVTTTTSTATGNSTVTVTGTGSGTKNASAGLTIQAPAPPTPAASPSPALPAPMHITPLQPEFYPHDKQGYAAVPGVKADGTVVTGYASVYSNIGRPDVGGATIAAATQSAVSQGAVPKSIAPAVPSQSLPSLPSQPNPAPTPAPAPSPTVSAPKISAAPVNSPPPTAKSTQPAVSPSFAALVRAIMNFITSLRFR